MIEIPLVGWRRHRKVALVDDEDWELIQPYTWYLIRPKPHLAYAIRSRPHIYMHHMIIPGVPRGLVRDHIDRNGLNNQKANIRIASYRENLLHG
jgi:hypothetical protein